MPYGPNLARVKEADAVSLESLGSVRTKCSTANAAVENLFARSAAYSDRYSKVGRTSSMISSVESSHTLASAYQRHVPDKAPALLESLQGVMEDRTAYNAIASSIVTGSTEADTSFQADCQLASTPMICVVA